MGTLILRYAGNFLYLCRQANWVSRRYCYLVCGCEGGDVIELVNGDTRIDIIVTIGNPDYWGKNVSLVKKPILPVEIRPSI